MKFLGSQGLESGLEKTSPREIKSLDNHNRPLLQLALTIATRHIHYFVRRDKVFRILEAYIPLITFIDAPLPNTAIYQEEVENVKKTLEKMERRREAYYRERLRAEQGAADWRWR